MDQPVKLVWQKNSPTHFSLAVGRRAIIQLRKNKSKWAGVITYLDRHTPDEKKWLSHFLAKPVVRILNGDFILHGALVKKGRDTVLIVAPSGTGKSTLSLHLIQNGWRCYTDDMTAISFRGKKVYAKSVRNSIALLPKSLRMLRLKPLHKNDKTRFRLPAQTKVLSLRRIVILQTRPRFKAHTASKTEAASLLLTSSWRPPLQLDSNFPVFLNQVTKLVEKVPCAVIEYPKQKSSLNRFMQYLES